LLILRVAGARALEVEHMRPRLIERINATFGYRAVSDIRVLQAPLPQKRDSRAVSADANRADAGATGATEDRLARALARISSGIEATRSAARPGHTQS
jgi:hypothetical protein